MTTLGQKICDEWMERLERRAAVALKFYRADELSWAYHPGEPEPRLVVTPRPRRD